MKNNYIAIWSLLILGLSAGGCKKQLNGDADIANVDGSLITDLQTAQAVLNGVYYRFANGGPEPSFLSPSTRWTDINEYAPSELAGTLSSDPPNQDSLYHSDFSTTYYLADSVWVYGYNLVNAANGFIRNATPVRNISAAAKQQMLAEARFLRAFGNSELLFNFGQYRDTSSKYGIILRDSFVTAANLNLPRSGVAAAYTSMLADLDAAIQGLPVLNSAIWYANASVARLLKARVLINRGTAGDYAQVIALTNDIITNGPFSLEDSVKDIFKTKGLASKEVMLGIEPFPNDNYKWFWYIWEVSDSFASLLSGDARNQWIYKYMASPFGDTINEMTKYYSVDPIDPVPTPLSVNSYAFRLTEAYLLEAEAITLSSGNLATAKTLLKTVLSHAGAGPDEVAAVDGAATPAALQLEIVKENMRNFTYENGVDWLALRRLPFATIQQLNPNIKDASRLILPIPTAELAENKVIQNPGY